MRLVIVTALAIAQTACITTKPDEVFISYDHISHPLQGPPFGPVADEGTLDSTGITARWVRGRYFAEAGVSYPWWPSAGLWGDNFLFNGRVGVTIWGDKR
jgi:hypothetical protein